MNSKNINIMVIPSGGMGIDGITISILNYYRNSNREKLKFTFIATAINGDEKNFDLIEQEIKKSGDTVLKIKRKGSIIKYLLTLFRVVKKGKYDILHVHGSSSLLALELLVGKLGGIKVRIAHSHNTMCNHNLLNKLLRPIFNCLVTTRLACGVDAGKWLYVNKDFQVLNNGIESEKFRFDISKREEMKKKLKLQNKKVIGHVGGFNIQKNQMFLVDIFEKLIEMDSNFHLVFVGDGFKRTEVENRVKEKELTDNVTFLGIRTDISDVLQCMDIMVLPSLHEGFPVVSLEWQAAGLKCILSDSITKDAKVTNLVEFESLDNSPEQWAKRIKDNIVYERKDTHQLIKLSGYDINDNANELVNIYTKSVILD